MSEPEPDLKSRMQKKFVWWGIFAAAILVAFLIGLVPMWLSARSCSAEHEITKTQLRKTEVHDLLTTSITEARRGEYEAARQTASEFFTRLRAEEEKGEAGFITAEQRTKIKPVFDNRDAAITMLAQRDQASLDRLTDIYAAYTQAIPAKILPAAAPPANVPAR